MDEFSLYDIISSKLSKQYNQRGSKKQNLERSISFKGVYSRENEIKKCKIKKVDRTKDKIHKSNTNKRLYDITTKTVYQTNY